MIKNLKPSTTTFAWPTLAIDLEKLQALHEDQVNPGNQYKLGAKIPLSVSPEEADGRPVDCSGYVRWLIYHASGKTVAITDGSFLQRDQIEDAGLKQSTVNACFSHDDVLRIAFLSLQDGGGVGHVVLVLNGETLESHGGTGPDSRPWTGKGWQAKCTVFVLTV